MPSSSFWCCNLAIGSRHIQESRGLLGPKSPKSLKKVFPGLPARSVKKVSKKSQMTRKRVKNDSKTTVRGLFRHFFDTPGGEAWEVLFETFWGFRGSGVWRLLSQGHCPAQFWKDRVRSGRRAALIIQGIWHEIGTQILIA